MNPKSLLRRTRIFRQLPFACSLMVAGVASAGTGPTNAPAASAPAKPIEVAKSTFAMPRDKKEGRDPFFPNSPYPWQGGGGGGSNGVKPLPAPTVDLKLTGIGGTAKSRICNINGRTFAKDEDGEMTVNGSKVQIHIVDILEDSVTLTVNGEQRVLRFKGFIQ